MSEIGLRKPGNGGHDPGPVGAIQPVRLALVERQADPASADGQLGADGQNRLLECQAAVTHSIREPEPERHPATSRAEALFARLGVLVASLATVLLLDAGASFLLDRVRDADLAQLRTRTSTVRSAIGSPRGSPADFPANSWVDLMSASPAYERYDWAESFWREVREQKLTGEPFRYVPFRLWAESGPYAGPTITLDSQGFRISPDPLTHLRSGSLTVYLFGGSTAFGTGSPDWETISAHLSTRLRQAIPDTRVVNLGVSGYTSNQEVILLAELLKAGHRPDLVIFYDGGNDTYVGSLSPGLPSAHDQYAFIKTSLEGAAQQHGAGTAIDWRGLVQRSATYRVVQGAVGRLRGASTPPILTYTPEGGAIAVELTDELLEQRSGATLDNWEANQALVRALGQSYGFSSLFAWQPVLLYGSKPHGSAEQVLIDHSELLDFQGFDPRVGRLLARAVHATYTEAERRAANGHFVFLARAFDHEAAPLFVDWIHAAPEANRIIATRLASEILTPP
jgi:hypothetical protein